MAEVADPQRVASPEAQLNAEGMERGVGFLGLLWASEGSIIGSGWLFGALTAASIAGPSAIIAWFVASLIVIVLALVHAELGGLFPVSGGTSRFPHYAFGSLAGGTFGWFSYLQAASVAPIEVLAAVQYLSSFSWASSWYSSTGTLSGVGILVAIALMFFFVCVNLIGIRWLARVNNVADVVEGADPDPDDHHARRLQVPRLELQRRRRVLHPWRRGQEHPDRDPHRRHRVLAAGLRAGGPVGRRGQEPQEGPAARGDPLDPDRLRRSTSWSRSRSSGRWTRPCSPGPAPGRA